MKQKSNRPFSRLAMGLVLSAGALATMGNDCEKMNEMHSAESSGKRKARLGNHYNPNFACSSSSEYTAEGFRICDERLEPIALWQAGNVKNMKGEDAGLTYSIEQADPISIRVFNTKSVCVDQITLIESYETIDTGMKGISADGQTCPLEVLLNDDSVHVKLSCSENVLEGVFKLGEKKREPLIGWPESLSERRCE